MIVVVGGRSQLEIHSLSPISNLILLNSSSNRLIGESKASYASKLVFLCRTVPR